MNTQRLDSAFSSSWNKWWNYIFLAFMWGITITGSVSGNPRVTFFYYILPPCTILILWWQWGFKQVTLVGDTLIIRDLRREAHIPVSLIEKVAEHRWNKGQAHITLVFRSGTEFGRRVRIMIGTSGAKFDRIAKILRGAMEGKTLSARINHLPRETTPVPSPANGKEVIVSGWTNEELSGILTDFAHMYNDNGELSSDFEYGVQPLDNGCVRIMFPHDIPARLFPYFINYLQYPKNYDLNVRSISVVGKALLTPEFCLPVDGLVGKKAIFYIPSNDRDFDLVYIRVGDETFENSFASRRWKKVADSRIPPGVDIKP